MFLFFYPAILSLMFFVVAFGNQFPLTHIASWLVVEVLQNARPVKFENLLQDFY